MPYNTDLPDTLIVDGTDLQTLAGVWLDDLGFLLAPATPRGEQDTIPGEDGRGGTDSDPRGVGLPVDAYQFTVPITVQCQDGAGATSTVLAEARGQFIANVRALAAAIQGSRGLVTLTRRLTNADGSGYDEETADGQFLGGLTPTSTDTPLRATFDLQFMNLSGRWYDGSAWNIP